MRVAVMGAGAVGCYFGARLKAAGHEVWFIARGERFGAMRQRGLRIESIAGDLEIPMVSVTKDPGTVGPVDLVLFTVKSRDTREAAEATRAMVRRHTTVLVLQNGVENEVVVGEVLGRDHVVPGVAVIGVDMPEPNLIRHTNNGTITIGEVSGIETRRIKAIQDAFAQGGVEARVSSDILSVKWRKLVWNAAFNPLAALTGMRVLELLEHEGTRHLAEEAMREAIAVGRARGHRVDEDLIQRGTERNPSWADSKTSMLQDVERGRPTEVDALTGVVVREGNRLGVPTPVSSTLLRLVRAKERAVLSR